MIVLYEDNHLIAVHKPPGMLTQGDASGQPSLLELTRAHLREKYGKPGNVFVGLLHRLDKSVSGVVLFAKTSKGASRLSEQFRARRIVKRYEALVEGRVDPQEGRLVDYFVEEDGRSRVVAGPVEGSKVAALGYRVLGFRDGRTELGVELETGRKHQIRIQLGRLGHPIVGDARYGATSRLGGPGIALCSVELAFRTATSEREVTVRLPPELRPF